ncbi:hypothetical protein B0H11DRAFT_2217066 [Mycena galericulata]|nr:hypothetical protein B0H11DRAFT_2217066 [Mycena galericulata]
MKSLIADLIISLETDAHANDLLYMCKLVQLVLNVDQFRRDWKNEGKGERTPGVAAIAESYGLESSLRTTLTEAYHDAVKDINSLADAIREVSEGKWRPLVLRLIAAIQYLQNTSIPVLDNYRFVRGEDTFTFVDVNKADEVLQSVQTCLFKLPVRAPDWNEAVSKPWASRLSSNEAIQPAEVVVIRTGLKLERTSSLPFKNGKEKSWTEQERGYAEQAAIPTSFEDFKAQILDLHKSGKCPRGKYIDLDSDILDGKTLVIEDATGMRVLTLMTMPNDMTERFDERFDGIDAVLPNEFSWEDSKRPGYTYTSKAYTWYYRMGEKASNQSTFSYPISYLQLG